MENTPMDYFLEVVRCGSITKAGRSLHVTPQAVSKAVAALEKELGFALLYRRADGCAPTEKGFEVQRLGLRMQRFNEQMMGQLRSLSETEEHSGEVRVAVSGAFALVMPPSDLSDFQTLYPHIRLSFTDCSRGEGCVKALISGKADLAFCSADTGEGLVECLQQHVITPYLIVSGSDPIALKKEVTLSELKNHRVIGDRLADGSLLLGRELAEAGIVPALNLPHMSDPLTRALVLEGGYTAFSCCPVGWLPYGIVPVRIRGMQPTSFSWFAKALDRPLSAAAASYVEFIIPRFEKDIYGEGGNA